MKRDLKWHRWLAALTLAWMAAPSPAFACAACFGQSNSAMARSMNWGIASLLVVVVGVLGGIASFFVYLAKRASTVPGPAEPALLPELTEKV
ncbi:MAG: hypothetical protein ACYDH9_02800 [Limisphaerales bacterium]